MSTQEWINTVKATPSGAVIPMAERTGRQLFCPFTSAVHPSAEGIHEESIDWARTMGLVKSDKQVVRLRASKIGWLVSRAFPRGERRALQIASDWTVVFCLLDDLLEKMVTTGEVDAYLGMLLKAFRGSVVPEAGDAFAQAMVDLRDRMLMAGGQEWVDRFGEQLGVLFICFGMEAMNRELGLTPDVVSYLQMREVTVGLYVEFEFFELVQGITLPPEVRDHPAMRRLASKASNIVGWANDICTFEKEMEQGELHNLVLVLKRSQNLSLQEAVNRAVYIHDTEVRAFNYMQKQVPSFGPLIDAQVNEFIAMLRSWIRGHLDWAQETGRYRPVGDAAKAEAA